MMFFQQRYGRFPLGMVVPIIGLSLVAHGFAANVFLHEDNANVVPVVGVTGFATEGDDMAGMSVTVYSNLSPAGDTAIWNVAGPTAGEAVGATGWRLRELGDTYSAAGPDGLWGFAATEPDLVVSRIVIDGFNADGEVSEKGTIFDRVKPEFGTEGSYRGRDFLIDSMVGTWDLDVTYRDPIQVDGLALIGETFRAVDISFIPTADQTGGLFRPNDFLSFRIDTDSVGLFDPGGCDRPECLPEPDGQTLLAICGLTIPLLRKRRRS